MLETIIQDLGVDLRQEFDIAAKNLEATGLSSYESKAYVGLVAMGFGTADEIAGLSRIPRTSSYKVLKSLEEKGFVHSTKQFAGNHNSARQSIFHVFPCIACGWIDPMFYLADSLQCSISPSDY